MEYHVQNAIYICENFEIIWLIYEDMGPFIYAHL